jgi:hypothetical protein
LETNLTEDEFEKFKKFMYDEVDAKGTYGEDWFFGYIIPEFRKRLSRVELVWNKPQKREDKQGSIS